MPRGLRPKPSSHLISDDIIKEIKSARPLSLFISKQKKKGSRENPFSLRVKYSQLPREKQARLLQKAVDRYIALLDENDVDEHIQIQCQLFDFLLIKSEQRKYFQSINAPAKPPGTAVPYYTQNFNEENDDDENEASWKSLSATERQRYKTRRKEAQAEYSAQVRNFANDLPERLRTDYLTFAVQKLPKGSTNNTSICDSPDSMGPSQVIRQRRKSLTALPESLQTTTTIIDDVQSKLTKIQFDTIHKCMPDVLYYETAVSNNDKPTFTRAMTKNSYIRSVFTRLDDKDRLKYILKSIKKWTEFLAVNPTITEHLIPTLHLLISRNEDILLYFSSIGLPQRPPVNSYLYYKKDEHGSQQAWAKLSSAQKEEYSEQLIEMKNDYYQKLVEFVGQTLPSDYVRYEFFRNVKYAVRDYELATKSVIIDENTGQIKFIEYQIRKLETMKDMDQFNQIKQRLLSSCLTYDQKLLVEEMSQLFCKYIK